MDGGDARHQLISIHPVDDGSFVGRVARRRQAHKAVVLRRNHDGIMGRGVVVGPVARGPLATGCRPTPGMRQSSDRHSFSACWRHSLVPLGLAVPLH